MLGVDPDHGHMARNSQGFGEGVLIALLLSHVYVLYGSFGLTGTSNAVKSMPFARGPLGITPP